jgi:hypothetical protein
MAAAMVMVPVTVTAPAVQISAECGAGALYCSPVVAADQLIISFDGVRVISLISEAGYLRDKTDPTKCHATVSTFPLSFAVNKGPARPTPVGVGRRPVRRRREVQRRAKKTSSAAPVHS